MKTADRPFAPAPPLSPAECRAGDRDLLYSDAADAIREIIRWAQRGINGSAMAGRLASRSPAQLRRLVAHLDAAIHILD